LTSPPFPNNVWGQQIFRDQQILWVNILLGGQQFFGLNTFWGQQILGAKYFRAVKILWMSKFQVANKNSRVTHFWVSQIFGDQTNLSQQFSGNNIFGVKEFLGVNNIGLKKIDKKYF
jgi:hypothetical protein